MKHFLIVKYKKKLALSWIRILRIITKTMQNKRIVCRSKRVIAICKFWDYIIGLDCVSGFNKKSPINYTKERLIFIGTSFSKNIWDLSYLTLCQLLLVQSHFLCINFVYPFTYFELEAFKKIVEGGLEICYCVLHREGGSKINNFCVT